MSPHSFSFRSNNFCHEKRIKNSSLIRNGILPKAQNQSLGIEYLILIEYELWHIYEYMTYIWTTQKRAKTSCVLGSRYFKKCSNTEKIFRFIVLIKGILGLPHQKMLLYYSDFVFVCVCKPINNKCMTNVFYLHPLTSA